MRIFVDSAQSALEAAFPSTVERPFHGRRSGRRRSGMSIVELMISLTILAIITLITMSAIATIIQRDRQAAMEVAGMQAINMMAAEIESLAMTAPNGELPAHYVVRHFAEMTGDRISIGPDEALLPRAEWDPVNGALVYRFWIPVPGESRFLEDDERFDKVKNNRALGEMYIHLNEAMLNAEIMPAFGLNEPGEGSEWIDVFDIDQNGAYTDDFVDNYEDVRQLAITIAVKFFSNDSHDMELFSDSRRVLMTRTVDPTRNFDSVRKS